MNKLLLTGGLLGMIGGAFAAEIQASLTVTRDGLANAHAVLSWSADAWSGATIEIQRQQEDKDWVSVASVEESAKTYTDTTALYFGVPYRYRLVCGDDVSESVDYRRIHRIGQNADGSLLKGVSIVCDVPPSSAPAENSFDGNVNTYTELGGGGNHGSGVNCPNHGLDFGEGNHAYISLARLYPRANSNYDYRLDGVNVYGDNDAYNGNGTALSTQLSIAKGSPDQWHEMACNSANGYRYIFFYSRTRATVNYGEIELYGWTDEDLAEAKAVYPIDEFSAAIDDGKIALSWECEGEPNSFVIERLINVGEWETYLTLNSSDEAYETHELFDDDVEYYNVYTYRVSAVYDEDTRVSDTKSLKFVEPMNLAVTYSDLTENFNAVLSWQNCASLPETSATKIWRSEDEGETWQNIATVEAGTLTYTDLTAATYGIRYLYRLTPADDETKLSDICSFYYVHRLGQNADASLLTGVQVVWNGDNYGNDGNLGTKCFDGNLSTSANLVTGGAWGQAYNAPVGLVFDKPYHIAFARIAATSAGDYASRRVRYSIVWGSNVTSSFNGATQLSGELDYENYMDPVEGASFKVLGCDPTQEYKMAFVQKQSGDQPSCGNYAEIEFYGWSDEDIVEPVTDFALEVLSGGQIALTWACEGSPDSFILERQVDGGEWETYETIASGSQDYTDRRFVDDDLEYHSNYGYRITARYESSDFSVLCQTVLSAECVEPIDFTVGYSDYTDNYFALLSWKEVEGSTDNGVDIYRLSGENGFEYLTTVEAGETTYTDETARLYGVCYRYYATPAGEPEKLSAIGSYYRVRRLDRDANNQFLPGVSMKCSYGGYCTELFDGDVNTYSQAGYDWGSPIVAVDFGANSSVHVRIARVYQIADRESYLNELYVSGSNNRDAPWNGGVGISGRLPADRAKGAMWCVFECDPTAAYQSAFVSGTGFNGRAGEVQFYGWDQTDVDSQQGMITGISVSPACDKSISVSWNCAGTPDSFTLWRKIGEGEWAELATYDSESAVYGSKAIVDTDVEYYGTYSYKVTADYSGIVKESAIAGTLCVEPMNLTVGYEEMVKKFYAKLDWQSCDTIADKPVAIYRSQVEGVWTKIATVEAGVLTYKDTASRVFGVRYQYRIAPDEAGAIKPSNIVDYYRVRRLDVRDENGQLASPVVKCCSYDTYCKEAFDGYLYNYDGSSWDWGTPMLGVSFGSADNHVCFVRFYQLNGQEATLNGVSVYGSAAMTDPWNSGTWIGGMTAANHTEGEGWQYIYTDSTTGYQSSYIAGSDCRFGEMEFYGWTKADLHGAFMLIVR